MRLSYPAELPISARKDEIVQAITSHRVVVIAGDTGSGKTTQIPKMCLEAGQGRNRLIGCTQPRRIAAVSVAERVAEELRDTGVVGYKIRFRDRTDRQTRIKFMTDGILLAETKNDRNLKRYDTIIIDEAHERSLNIDFLLGYLKTLIVKRPDLKLVIASATLDTEKFSAHFANAPIINVSGRTYPIRTEYMEADAPDQPDSGSYVEQAVNEAVSLAENPLAGDILIFMPTERDILDCAEMLEGKLEKQALVLPLFGRLHARDQRKIFLPARRRKIIVATNIAETSLTVPGIRYVIDSGLARISRYNPRARTTSLQVSRISRASCDQRAGRCGRTGPGHCIRLYSEGDYQSRPEFTQPEIQRSNLAEVILQMISLQLGDPRDFPFIDPPSINSIRDGYKTLRELGALTSEGVLTGKGKIMAGLPLDPCISRIIIEAAENGALRELKIIAAGLSIQDPRIRPLEKEAKADEMHRRFAHKQSDFLGLLNIWDGYQAMAGRIGSKAKLKKFCAANYLSWQRMREWQDIHDQINQLLKGNRRFHDNVEPASYEAVHQALLSGFLRNIGQKKEKNIYTISGGREVMIFPGSSLFNGAGQWIVSTSFMETGRLYAMSVASIDALWLERIGGDLCRRSWSDPHWEKKTGRVVALEKVTLFGLVIVAGRKVNYAGTSDSAAGEAREIFLQEALVAGELGGRYPFFQHNQALIKRLHGLEHRTRRRDILVDDAAIHAFYDKRLGPVHDRHTLNREIRKQRDDRFLWMTEQDIVQGAVAADELYRFPETLKAGGHAVGLQYCFEPGHEKDGITADIPVSLADHFNPVLFEWLVPGLLEEKITALLKGLPKQLRRRFVPLPDTAARIMDTLELYQGSLYAALEKSILKLFQVRIMRTDWHPEKLPSHLKMRFRLLDENRNVLLTSRTYRDLQHQSARDTKVPADIKLTGPEISQPVKNIRTWDFTDPPGPVPRMDQDNLLAGFLYPALVINPATRSLELHYTADRLESQKRNHEGLRFLYALQFPTETKALERECKQAVTSHSASWLSLGTEFTAAELTARLKNFLLDDMFSNDGDRLPSASEFAARVSAAREKELIQTWRTQLDLLLKLLSGRRHVSSTIEVIAGSSKSMHDPRTKLAADLVKHLQQILPSDFLVSRKPAHLNQVPRYLKALEIRVDRAQHSLSKDTAKARQVAAVADRLKSIAATPDRSADCLRCLAEYREMVEEFRVSVFAPELGTAFPVSEKRLKKKWQEAENICHRVE
ncbi:MAG: ATP-dependent RNA helicase HrpA [Desulfobulbaceae bacterium]|nr:ATP-dependent RNA helicase HrpA [Desulfobulbaceae bacterium]